MRIFSCGQYASEKGIVFAGDNPFITGDGANPTSPVLSGSPRFSGKIGGYFVNRKTLENTTVQSFEFDAGYFNELGSTRLEWFDPKGNVLGQTINVEIGIEAMKGEGGNIASFLIGIFETEPAGYAIDNFVSTPIGPSLVFREMFEKEGTWGFLGDDIPGFDHVALHIDNVVYESNLPKEGVYIDAANEESVTVSPINGVQKEFTLATFKHNSMDTSTKVKEVIEIPISEEDAMKMRDAIEPLVNSAGFSPINRRDLSSFVPAAQKGGGGTYTCVGLIEWAAEQAGINGGQGFIPNFMESIKGLTREYPLLSPQLLYLVMTGSTSIKDAKQFLKGFLDPIDYIITDPLVSSFIVLSTVDLLVGRFVVARLSFAKPAINLRAC